MTSSSLLRTLCLAVVIALTSATASATEHYENDTPTGWLWLYGQTAAQVSAHAANGFRLVDIEVEQASPIRFTVAFVKNTGSHAKGFWWYYGVSTSSVSTLVSQNNARLIDVEPYDLNGALRYAVIMIPNTGSDAKAWWWSVSANFNDIVNDVNANGARVVDIEETDVGATHYYAAIMIKNSGADAKGWYWWIGTTESFLSSEIASKNLRLIDLERRPDGKYDAILIKNDEAFHWWWYVGQSEASLNAIIAQTGSRVIDVQRVGGLFYAILLNNSNDLTTRVGDILRNGSDGVTGLYLKQVNGGVRAALQEGFVFEPASTIKTLMHVHAMKQIEQSSASLGESLTVFTGTNGSCPQYFAPISEGMEQVLKLMMENSDNNRTMAIRDRFGNPAINGMGTSLGMTNTQIIHTLGCGGPPANQLTLIDGGVLHEAVANGYLGAQRQKCYDLMLQSVNGYGGGQLGGIIDQEGAALSLPASVISSFKANMQMAYKGGSYGYNNPLDFFYSVLAWVKIPFKNGAVITPAEYVTGVFVHDASSNSQAASSMNTASAELLRDEIRAALETWTNSCTNPASNATYGVGKPGTNGVPFLQALDLPIVGAMATIRVSNALPGAFSTLFLGVQQASIPFDGGALLVNNPLVISIPIPFDVAGSWTLAGQMPNDPSLCGLTLYHQVMYVDPGASGFYQTAQTNGLARTLGG